MQDCGEEGGFGDEEVGSQDKNATRQKGEQAIRLGLFGSL